MTYGASAGTQMQAVQRHILRRIAAAQARAFLPRMAKVR